MSSVLFVPSVVESNSENSVRQSLTYGGEAGDERFS